MRDFRTAIYAACGFLNDVQRIGGAACIRRQRKSPGVLAVITHLSAPKLAEPPNDQKRVGIRIEEREPLADDKISYGGQYVAAIVADTSEDARHAASVLKISYAPEKPALRKQDAIKVEKPKEHLDEELQRKKGDVGAALARGDLIK